MVLSWVVGPGQHWSPTSCVGLDAGHLSCPVQGGPGWVAPDSATAWASEASHNFPGEGSEQGGQHRPGQRGLTEFRTRLPFPLRVGPCGSSTGGRCWVVAERTQEGPRRTGPAPAL